MAREGIVEAVSRIKGEHGGYKTWRMFRMLAKIQLLLVDFAIGGGLIFLLMGDGFSMVLIWAVFCIPVAITVPMEILLDGFAEPFIMRTILKGRDISLLDENQKPYNFDSQIAKIWPNISMYMASNVVWEIVKCVIASIVTEIVMAAVGVSAWVLGTTFGETPYVDIATMIVFIIVMACFVIYAKITTKKTAKEYKVAAEAELKRIAVESSEQAVEV